MRVDLRQNRRRDRALAGVVIALSIAIASPRLLANDGAVHAVLAVLVASVTLLFFWENNRREQSEANHRRIVDEASEIIFTMDTAGTITSLNPAFERITGRPCADWIGRPLVDLVAPDERASVAEMIESAHRTPSDNSVRRATLLRADGSRVVVEASVVVHVVNDVRQGFLGFARDVTGHAHAMDELRRNERMLAESQRIAKLGSWDFDLETGRVRWSDETFCLLGLQPGVEEPTLERFLEFVVPVDRARVVAVKDALTGESSFEFEARLELQDGKKKTVRITADTATTPDGRILAMGVIQDVTDWEIAQRQLRETEERFHLLARATNDGTYDWDIARDELWWGDSHYALFGYSPGSEPSIATWKERVHPDDRDRVLTSFDLAAQTGQETWSEEYRYRRADGTYAVVLDRAMIMHDAQMRPVRVVGALTDMTERKHLQEQLAQAKRVSSLGRVAASIAHEFNNVLMGIQPNLEVIRRRGPDDLRAPIEHILQSVRRGKRVTDEILRFTRPGAPGLQCVAVDEFFEKWSAEIRPVLGSNIDIDLDIEDNLYMTADPLQIAQVFTNLAINARDAMTENGGSLTISASVATSFGSFSFGVVKSADRYVHFRVRDTGCGMTKEQLAHVFEPLFTTKKNGTGLGLAVSYQLVLQHEGYMFVESQAGAGSTFHVFLLAGSPILRLVEPQQPESMAMQRVLIVEDEVAVAMGIRSLLELENVAVDMVHSGGEAMPAIERFRPDCLILDIGLPDINGADLYREVSQRWPSLSVLFSSGHADAAKLEPLLRSSRTALLLKPYDFDTLKTALTRLTSARPALEVCTS